MEKQTARIDNWENAGQCLYGDISEHPHFNGYGHTSRIVLLDEENGTCETLNTVFTLGARKVSQ